MQIQRNPPAQQGWQCPVCRTVNAPWAAICMGCPKTPIPVTSPSTSPVVVPTVWPPTITTCGSATLVKPPEDEQYTLWNSGLDSGENVT